jgi:hypothetical protein
MKFTKNQAIVILAGVVLWFITMIACYATGLVAHEVAHF